MNATPVRLAKHPEISAEAALVRDTLIARGLETPMIETGLTGDQKYDRIRDLMTDVMETLGLDLSDDSLAETPHRIAKMYVREIFSGLDYTKFPKLSLIENKMGTSEMVKIREIDLTSTCEHHFVTIDGTAKVAYIPSDRIIGLSKINRIVQFFAKLRSKSSMIFIPSTTSPFSKSAAPRRRPWAGPCPPIWLKTNWCCQSRTRRATQSKCAN